MQAKGGCRIFRTVAFCFMFFTPCQFRLPFSAYSLQESCALTPVRPFPLCLEKLPSAPGGYAAPRYIRHLDSDGGQIHESAQIRWSPDKCCMVSLLPDSPKRAALVRKPLFSNWVCLTVREAHFTADLSHFTWRNAENFTTDYLSSVCGKIMKNAGDNMSESKLRTQFMDFAVSIINLVSIFASRLLIFSNFRLPGCQAVFRPRKTVTRGTNNPMSARFCCIWAHSLNADSAFLTAWEARQRFQNRWSEAEVWAYFLMVKKRRRSRSYCPLSGRLECPPPPLNLSFPTC